MELVVMIVLLITMMLKRGCTVEKMIHSAALCGAFAIASAYCGKGYCDGHMAVAMVSCAGLMAVRDIFPFSRTWEERRQGRRRKSAAKRRRTSLSGTGGKPACARAGRRPVRG